MKSMPDMYTQHQFRVFIFFQNNDSRRFLQLKSANLRSLNIFLIEAAGMLASTQIKTVKPPDKSHGSPFLHLCRIDFNSFRQKLCKLQHPPDRAAQYSMLAFLIQISSSKYQKFFCVCTTCALQN